MAIKLEKVVPFGRCLDEYIQMFNLTAEDLNQKILSVADGPASFNAEGTQQGYQITSIDPVYQFTGEEIHQRFNAVVDTIIEQIADSPQDWVWSYHASPEALRQSRINTLKNFLTDYDLGKQQKRYILGELPKLPFADQQFDLALCSHFLFLYSEHLSLEFHQSSILEMLRVAREVRIFSLMTLSLKKSPYLAKIIEIMSSQGYQISLKKVNYEFQKGGNEMLVIHQNKELYQEL